MSYQKIPYVPRRLTNNNFREYNKTLRPWAKHRILVYMYYAWKMHNLHLTDFDQVTVNDVDNEFHPGRTLLKRKTDPRLLQRAFVKLIAGELVRRHGTRKKYSYTLTDDGLQKAKYIWNNSEKFGIDVYRMEKEIGAHWY